MKNVLGLDLGYGYTKSFFALNGFSEDISKYDIFPTAVTTYIPKSTFTANKLKVTVNGDTYMIGENALREGVGLINTRRTDFVGSGAYLAVMAYAFSRTIKDPELLVLGLPPGQFSKEYVTSLKEQINSAEIRTSDGSNIRLPEIIKIIPQGAGIFFSHIQDGNEADFSRKVAIIDIGFYTLDTLFFVKGKYVENSAKSHPLGVSRIHELVRKEFQLKYKNPLKDRDTIERFLRDSKVNLIGNDYELDTKKIMRSYNDEVAALISNYIEELPSEADLLIAGGGGAQFLKDMPIKY